MINKILITGGAGFIGSNLAKHLNKENLIIIVDNLSMGSKKNISNLDNVIFYEESILNEKFMKKLLCKENFDYIFHLAAVASVADSIERPLETNQVNFNSTIKILDILKSIPKSNLKRFIFASSAAVYGDNINLPKSEKSFVEPQTPYAIDKYASERYTLIYNDLYEVPTSCVRFFNVYGPNQNPSSPYSGVISIILDRFEKEIRKESAVFNLYGDGEQSRDFIYVKDVVQALKLVAYSNRSLGKVYNVGTGIETTLNNLIETVSDILDVSINIDTLDEREGDIKRSVCAIDELKTIGFNPEYTIEKGLKQYIKYLELKK